MGCNMCEYLWNLMTKLCLKITHRWYHTHTWSCISTSIVVFLNWFRLSHTWGQKCTKQAPPSNLILWGAFDTVERRDGSTNVTWGSILGVGVYMAWVFYRFSSLLREVIFPGAPVFPSPQKPTLLNSNSTRNTRTLNGETTPHVLERK